MAECRLVKARFVDALDAYIREHIREHARDKHDQPGGVNLGDKREELWAALDEVLDYVPAHGHDFSPGEK